MIDSSSTLLEFIGNTPMVPLRKIVSRSGARIVLKMESFNPTGSMKDRAALAMIETAETDGRLRAGGSVIEYTGGSTGISLALVCAIRGHPFHVVSSDAFASEKLNHMRILGARLTVVPSDDGRMTEDLTRTMIDVARQITGETSGFWTDQLNNRDQLAGYARMGHEIWSQCGGKIDALVQSVGTAASLRGSSEVLRQYSSTIRVVAVEPKESAVLSGGPTGAHGIDGVGAGFVVPLWHDQLADDIETVTTGEAHDMALQLARDEGIFGGTSTGANVLAALRVAEQLPSGATVVTIACDDGLKSISKYGALTS